LGCGLGWAVGIVLHGLAVLKECAMATEFGMPFNTTGFVGCNLGCVIAIDTV